MSASDVVLRNGPSGHFDPEPLCPSVHYVPIVTTILAAFFSAEIFRRYRAHPERLHLLVVGARHRRLRRRHVHRGGDDAGRMERADVPRVVHLGRAARRRAARAGHGVPAAVAPHGARVDGAARQLRADRVGGGDPVADRLLAGRNPSPHRPRPRVAVGEGLQPVREHVRRRVPDRRRDPVGAALQRQSRDHGIAWSPTC